MVRKKSNLKLIICIAAGILLSACDSQNKQGAALGIHMSDALRQTLSVSDNSSIRVEIQVNDGALQLFDLDGSQAQPVVNVFGIQAGAANSIEVKWYIAFGGSFIAISSQSQTFVASGAVTIDAPHSFAYDYDDDGISNYSEIINGTCVWADREDCNLEQSTTDSTVLMDETFSSPLNFHSWVSGEGQVIDGEHCFHESTTRYGAEGAQFLSFTEIIFAENQSHTLSFNVYAQTPASINFNVIMFPEDTNDFSDEVINISTEKDTYIFAFSPAENSREVFMSFSVPESPNYYCFDNIRITTG